MTEAMLTPWGEALDREHPLPEYPRPQLRRNSYLNLNGIWEYAITKTAEKPAAMQGEIVVPFSPETPLSGVGHILQPDEYLWYRRSVTLPEGFFRGGRLLLHFGAVDQCCTVWVDGQEVGSHTGGYLPFALDVTELIEGDAFTLELRVTDPTDTGSLSRGKQRLKNTGIWYTPQSGIWQTVWMECVPENYLRSLRITPKPEENAVHIRLEADDPAMAAVTICRDGGIIAEGQTDENGESTLTIPAEELRLWSPENPFLYDAAITLAGGDKVESYFGMRAFGIGKDEKGLPRLLLNGKPYFQNGLLDQGYWSDGYYTAPSDEALIHDIAEMKRLGFNMLRKHIKVEPLRWYYHCDRLGMLVWQDMVSGGVMRHFMLKSALSTIGSFTTPATLLIFAVMRPLAGGALLGVVVVLAAMPVATNGTMFCYQYGGDAKTMAQGTFITTILALVTIPLLATFSAVL